MKGGLAGGQTGAALAGEDVTIFSFSVLFFVFFFVFLFSFSYKVGWRVVRLARHWQERK